FGSSIVTLNKKNNQQSDDQAYAAQIMAVEQKINQAESSMIFEDEAHAIALLAEAQTALSSVPRDSGEHIAAWDTLKQRIDQTNQKIHKVYPVTQTEITNLSNQIPTLEGIAMTASPANILVYNNDSVYLLSRSSGTVTQINTQAKIPSIGCANALSDDLFYFCNKEGDRLYEVNIKNKETKQITVKLAPKETLQHITFFNNRLYVLDAASNTIYRHSKNKDGFGSPIEWYNGTAAASLNDGRQIIIDGTAFVLKKGTDMLRISSSKASSIALPKLEPTPGTVHQFWVAEESDSLYLLDTANKRILVLDKTRNKVTAQLTADILSSARSFTVAEKKKEIIILTDNSIVSIPLAHLK
ncbi:MAG: hypothetical protein AAB870_00055, partial [Patescibacteria group bacterium]